MQIISHNNYGDLRIEDKGHIYEYGGCGLIQYKMIRTLIRRKAEGKAWGIIRTLRPFSKDGVLIRKESK